MDEIDIDDIVFIKDKDYKCNAWVRWIGTLNNKKKMYGVELFKSIGKHNGKQKFTCKQYEKYIAEEKESNPKNPPKYGAFIRPKHVKLIKQLSVRIQEREPNISHTTHFGTAYLQKKERYQCIIKYGPICKETNDRKEKLYANKKQYDSLITAPFMFAQLSAEHRFEINARIPCWLNCDLRLDEINNKGQYFVISGWINVKWREPQHTDLYQLLINCYDLKETDLDRKNVWHFGGNKIKMRVSDLREADKISYYLPIDPRSIFEQTSVKDVVHRGAPHLVFDRFTGMASTEFNVQATLQEHFELFVFPFDKQFLNIKLRWNLDFYKILSWKEDVGKKNVGKQGKDGHTHLVPKIDGLEDETARNIKFYYDHPFKIDVIEDIKDDILLHEPWVCLHERLEDDKDPARFALISLRFTRNPTYFVFNILFPLFVIVICGFSVFAIPSDEIADRLSVSLTVLLTFAAFQSIRGDSLPNTAELSILDYYIVWAYVCQILMIGIVIFPTYLGHMLSDEGEAQVRIFSRVLFFLWVLPSILYIVGGMIVWLAYSPACCNKCNRCRSENNKKKEREEFGICDKYFWLRRARKERKQWDAVRDMNNQTLSFERDIAAKYKQL